MLHVVAPEKIVAIEEKSTYHHPDHRSCQVQKWDRFLKSTVEVRPPGILVHLSPRKQNILLWAVVGVGLRNVWSLLPAGGLYYYYCATIVGDSQGVGWRVDRGSTSRATSNENIYVHT